MKTKVAISVLLVLSTIAVGKILTVPPEDQTTNAEEIAPAYAKWGRMAMQNVMAKYPTSDVIDYLHIGREVGSVTSVEKFKLWLKAEDNSEFGVFVDITFNNQTEEVVDIKYTETKQ
ncbi:DUF3889 domain-containing protein [Ureibacillus chungkukjangi]|uniref:Uncharacterized protein DUF3889 n=1 Tax=Ureibacillus chungkukjangi TaxID=1202712 RepID=A0A318TSC7_9BACL|nr:DUF3889 domain-containing protein [Ureibacillus chungkukjangi]MCM3390097.1 YqzG/YhdC family protein [Ureibacillus chungkukjangi]PYF07233.1 uncharacterized protein DUF3889 [Ureibacillus chungkukjangi]